MFENKEDIKQLKRSIKKCLCACEKPLKAKHARIIVLKTHQIKGGHRIWTIAEAHNLTENRFVMWKFCLLMHKILHEGHKQVLQDSLTYQTQLQKYGKYWSSQNDQCIAWYCHVLLTKMSFHQRYTHFEGNLQYEYKPSFDVNNIFQLCLDLLDYLENLLHLQRVIFSNLQKYQISGDSKEGMCRLVALVTIIPECNSLYLHSLAALQTLNSQLSSPDDISGFSERFQLIFDELKTFFQYVRDQRLPLDSLVVPRLPMSAPNVLCSAAPEHYREPSAPSIVDLDDLSLYR